MPTHILFLDLLVLFATLFPSGFTGTLATALRIETQGASASFLLLSLSSLVLACAAALAIHPELFVIRASHPWILGAAVLAAPLTLALEWCVHNAFAFVRDGVFWHRIQLHAFWDSRQTPLQLGLLTLIAAAEELVFRQIWIGGLNHTLGLSAGLALCVSAAVFGLNHLYFGWASALAKTVAGFVYGGLFLLDGMSLWSPLVAHALQNLLLLSLPGKRTA